MTQLESKASSISQTIYEGLEVDTRAKEQKEKYLSTVEELQSPVSPESSYSGRNEKRSWVLAHRHAVHNRNHPSISGQTIASSDTAGLPTASFVSSDNAGLPTALFAVSEMDTTLEPKRRSICGLRRRCFWIAISVVVAIVIIAAVVGGVVAGQRAQLSSSPLSSQSPLPSAVSSPSPTAGTTAPTITPGASISSLPPSDVMVDSPLVLVAFTSSSTSNWNITADEQAYQLFFQSANGNIKQSNYYSASPWASPNPIFTDAKNNTGMAVCTYLNGSIQQSSIFYVGDNGNVQEKRLYAGTTVWEPGTLNNYNLEATGNISAPGQDLKNDWDSYRMAVVYSESFATGPGARLFYHVQLENGNPIVQEMIWNKAKDVWSQGYQFSSPSPNSALAATIDTSTKTLRLYYSAGNSTLQERWLDITNASAVYQPGIEIPSILPYNDTSLAAVSTTNNTLLYYSTINPPSIREITISGIPGSSGAFTAPKNAPIVAQPALLVTNTSQSSLYAPLGAIVSTANTTQSIHVVWVEGVVDPGSGYSGLQTVSRNVTSIWPATSYGAGEGEASIPLGDHNANPP